MFWGPRCAGKQLQYFKCLKTFNTRLLGLHVILEIADLPSPITCKSGGFEKQAQKNLEITTSNLEKIWVK